MYHNPLYKLERQPLAGLGVFKNYLDTFAGINCWSLANFDPVLKKSRNTISAPELPVWRKLVKTVCNAHQLL